MLVSFLLAVGASDGARHSLHPIHRDWVMAINANAIIFPTSTAPRSFWEQLQTPRLDFLVTDSTNSEFGIVVDADTRSALNNLCLEMIFVRSVCTINQILDFSPTIHES